MPLLHGTLAESTRQREQPVLLRRTLRQWSEWVEFYDTRIANVVFCLSGNAPEVGTRVLIDLIISKEASSNEPRDEDPGEHEVGPRLRLEGVVTWRRLPSSDERLRAGMRIRLSNAQRKLLDRIDDWLRSGVRNRRRHRRLPMRMRATYATQRSRRRVNFVTDLSLDGLFLSSSQLLSPRTPIWLSLFPPGEPSPLMLAGTVARCMDEADQRGLGVALSFDDEASRRSYAELLGRLEDRYVSGELSQRNLS